MSFLVAQCGLVFFSRNAKFETKSLITSTIAGFRLPLINVLMAFWTVFWTLRYFIAAEAVLFLAVLSACSIGYSILQFEKSAAAKAIGSIPYGVVTVPLRMMIVIMLSVDLGECWH